MVKFDFSNFFAKNTNHYKRDVDEAKGMHDNMKKFNEQIPEDKKIENMMRSLLNKVDDNFDALMENLNSTNVQTTGNPSGALTGTIQEQFWQFYRAAGYSKEAVAGMMGNIRHESLNWDTAAQEQSGPKEGFGLIQWSFGRKDALFAHAEKEGKPKSDFKMQLEYLQMELEGLNGVHNHWITNGYNGRYSYDDFKQSNDVVFATNAFCWAFLRPSIKHAHIDRRRKYAQEYYEEFKDYTPAATSSNGEIVNPAPGIITSPYGMRLHPIQKVQKMHKGIDIAGAGTELYAAFDGTVTINKFNAGGFGWYIKINHGTINGKKIETLYAHLAKASPLSLGERVRQGQNVGVMGTTGGSRGVHLHFEIHENGNHVDPENYVSYERR